MTDQSHLVAVESDYAAMINKDFSTMKKCLRSDVSFISLLAETSGREAVMDSAKNPGMRWVLLKTCNGTVEV